MIASLLYIHNIYVYIVFNQHEEKKLTIIEKSITYTRINIYFIYIEKV